jgi:hypothetical protein
MFYTIRHAQDSTTLARSSRAPNEQRPLNFSIADCFDALPQLGVDFLHDTTLVWARSFMWGHLDWILVKHEFLEFAVFEHGILLPVALAVSPFLPCSSRSSDAISGGKAEKWSGEKYIEHKPQK